MNCLIVISVFVFILIFHFITYYLSYLSYSRIEVGDKVVLLLEKYQFYKIEDIVVKVENDYIYTKNNGVFTFKDYLNNTIV